MKKVLQANKTDVFYNPALDGLRFVAILLVLLHHYPKPVYLYNYRIIGSLSDWFSHWGWIGVDLSLVISSFLITTLLLREHKLTKNINIINFHKRRMLRILPLYYLALLLACVVFPLLHFTTLSPSFGSPEYYHLIKKNLPMYIAFLYNFDAIINGQVSTFLGPLWLISLEQQFYLIWPVLLYILLSCKKSYLKYVVLLFLIALTVFIRYKFFFYYKPHPFIYYNTFSRLDPLLCGAACAFVSDKISIKNRIIKVIILFLSILIFVFSVSSTYIDDIKSINLVWIYLGLAVSFSLFIFFINNDDGWIKYFLSLKPLVWLGKISFGIYVYHLISYLLLRSYLIHFMSASMKNTLLGFVFEFILMTATTILMAAFSYYFIEKRFLAMKLQFTVIKNRI